MKRLGVLWRWLSRPPVSVLRQRVSVRHVLVGAAGCGLLGGLCTFNSDLVAVARERLQLASVQAARVDEGPGGGGERPNNVNFIADVVEEVLPAVVFIEAGSPHPFVSRPSSGSGFLVRDDGLIVTNGHVVGNNRSVRVRLANGQTLNGTVLAIDSVIDIALVAVSAKNLPTLSIGESRNLRTGEWVVALGSPHFLTNSVTVGVVSAKDRDLGHHRGMKYIQTDAVITHGNSGGPLVNVRGEVVGINTMKLEAGIGFAVPSDVVSSFVEHALRQLEKKSGDSGGGILGRLFSRDSSRDKEVSSSYAEFGESHGRRTYIGISMLTLNPGILRDLALMRPGYFDGISHGVLVHSVHRNSPADTAGLKPLDVIVSINGRKVHSADEVHTAVQGKQSLQLGVVRGGREVPLTVEPEYIDDR